MYSQALIVLVLWFGSVLPVSAALLKLSYTGEVNYIWSESESRKYLTYHQPYDFGVSTDPTSPNNLVSGVFYIDTDSMPPDSNPHPNYSHHQSHEFISSSSKIVANQEGRVQDDMQFNNYVGEFTGEHVDSLILTDRNTYGNYPNREVSNASLYLHLIRSDDGVSPLTGYTFDSSLSFTLEQLNRGSAGGSVYYLYETEPERIYDPILNEYAYDYENWEPIADQYNFSLTSLNIEVVGVPAPSAFFLFVMGVIFIMPKKKPLTKRRVIH